MTIETLFLDAGGVLVHPNWQRVSALLADHGIAVAPEALALHEPHAKHALDVRRRIAATADTARATDYLDDVLTRAGVPPTAAAAAARRSIDAYHARYNLWEDVPSEVPLALARLRTVTSRLVVVSNANGTVRQVLERVGLGTYLDDIVDSADEGVEKPDPELFRRALQRAGARPETTLHIGDLYEVDVVGARGAGLHAVLLDAAGLYADADCERVPSLDALADRLSAGRSAPRPT